MRGFPGGSDSRESACNAGEPGSIPGWGKIPWRRKRAHTSVFLPGEFHGQRTLAGCSLWHRKESGIPKWLLLSAVGCLPVAGVGKYLLVEGTLELYRVSRSSSRWRRRKHQTNAYVSSRQGNKCALGLNLVPWQDKGVWPLSGRLACRRQGMKRFVGQTDLLELLFLWFGCNYVKDAVFFVHCY